jgi:hypothetical protein
VKLFINNSTLLDLLLLFFLSPIRNFVKHNAQAKKRAVFRSSLINLRMVDFPLPEGPIRHRVSPSFTWNVISDRTGVPSNHLSMF